jgi:hypothetical protein
MTNEFTTIAIWLPLNQSQLQLLEELLSDANVIVPGNYEGANPYSLKDYLVTATRNGCEFRALFDRNIISPITSLIQGKHLPNSPEARKNAQIACACMCFCILAQITIEPNMAVYEFASRKGNEVAQEDIRLFRLADNADPLEYFELATGSATHLSQNCLEFLRNVPDLQSYVSPESNFERSLRMWKPIYLTVLKAISLRRSGLRPLDAAERFLHWQAHEAFFSGPASMYCLAAISHQPPKGGMLKGIQSDNLALLAAGAKNAAWDILLLQQFGRVARSEAGKLWALWSNDLALKEVARCLFVRGDESEVHRLNHFYHLHWGERDGNRLLSIYQRLTETVQTRSSEREAKLSKVFASLAPRIQALEVELGLNATCL